MADSKNIQQELLPGYEWTTCNLRSDDTCAEVCQFLNVNYGAEGGGKTIEPYFSMELLRWLLCPPEYEKDWHLGVRDKNSKLVAFMSGVPVLLRVMESDVPTAKIRFLCVHKDLRNRKLASVMIAKMTERVQSKRVGQAIYVGNIARVATCSYTIMMRKLDPKKLLKAGLTVIGDRMNMSRTIKLNNLPDAPVTPNFSKMETYDKSGVKKLLNDNNGGKKIGVTWDDDTIEHLLMSKEDHIHSYVVRDHDSFDVTDFCSFYSIPKTFTVNGEKTTVKCAYSLYNVARKTKLTELINDALIMAKQEGMDVFYALDMGEGENFWKELKFDEAFKINYYIHDASGKPISPLKPSEIGIVLW